MCIIAAGAHNTMQIKIPQRHTFWKRANNELNTIMRVLCITNNSFALVFILNYESKPFLFASFNANRNEVSATAVMGSIWKVLENKMLCACVLYMIFDWWNAVRNTPTIWIFRAKCGSGPTFSRLSLGRARTFCFSVVIYSMMSEPKKKSWCPSIWHWRTTI